MQNLASAPAAATRRYPTGLCVLCLVVGAERFSFHLLSTFLVLYLNERLSTPADRAIAIYGYFVCGSYLAPLLGGRLVDSRLGARVTTLLGGVPLCLGYLALFIAHIAATEIALILIIIGSGLFKPGTQAMLFRLFAPGDARRVDGFSLFYVALNVSTLTAPLLGGIAQRQGGWLPVFVLASCGILCSLSVLELGRASLDGVQRWQISDGASDRAGSPFQSRLQLIAILLAGLVFGIASVQSHSSMLLWIRDHIDRQLGHFEIPVAWFAAAPSALVLLMAPVLRTAFGVLRGQHSEPTTMQKIFFGLLLSCVAFLPLWVAPRHATNPRLVSPLWILGCLTLLATAELLVLALAPAEIMRLSPVDHRGRWISYWFVALAAGHMLGGRIHF